MFGKRADVSLIAVREQTRPAFVCPDSDTAAFFKVLSPCNDRSLCVGSIAKAFHSRAFIAEFAVEAEVQTELPRLAQVSQNHRRLIVLRPRFSAICQLSDNLVSLHPIVKNKAPSPPTLAKPERGEHLSGQIARTLHDAILSGKWPPGARLPTEHDLAAQFDVSRPVIREAMSVLKHEGLVISRQGSGAFVNPELGEAAPSHLDVHTGAADILQFVELRRAIEVEAAALAAVRHSAQDLRRIEKARDALNRKIAAEADSVEEGFAFHRAIVLASQNSQLVGLLDQIKPMLTGTMRVMRESGAHQAAYTASVKREHDDVLDAIASGNSERARHAALNHFEASEARIRATEATVWVEKNTVPSRRPAAPDAKSQKR